MTSFYIRQNMSELMNSSTDTVALQKKHRLPHPKTLENACRISMSEDRPIMMDYWETSLEKVAMIGVQEDKEKMLIKNEEEYTSYIKKMLRVEEKDYIIITENSIYLVDAAIPVKKVSL